MIKGLEDDKRKVRESLKELEKRIKGVEIELSRLEEKVRGAEKWVEGVKNSEGEEEGESSGADNGTRSTVSVNSVYSGKRIGSEKSLGETSGDRGLSMREVEKIKRWVGDKEREERRCNIILRRIRMPKETEKEWKRGRDWGTVFIKKNIGAL